MRVLVVALLLAAVAHAADLDSVTHTARLAANKEAGSVTSNANGAAVARFFTDTKQFVFALSHTVSAISAAHIHGPANPGQTAPILITLNPTVDWITGTYALTDQQIFWLNAGLLYFNVHSPTYPAGEIRGQILKKDAIEAVCTGAQENPPTGSSSRCWGLVKFNDPVADQVSYNITHDVATPTNGHIHTCAPWCNGPVVIPFASPFASPISGIFTSMTATQKANFLDGQGYINIHTSSFPGGEIRGQLDTRADYACYMTKDQVIGATSTETGAAIGTFIFRPTSKNFTAYLNGNLSPTSIQIYGPASRTATAAAIATLTVSGGSATILLTDTQITYLQANQLYIQVGTAAGGVRGQIQATTAPGPRSAASGLVVATATLVLSALFAVIASSQL